MYFPYLRGKQFDLIAIRELSGQISESGVIHPIIEPVRDSTSTLRLTANQLIEDEVSFTLIINPRFGDYTEDFQEVINFTNLEISNHEVLHIGILLDNNTNLDDINRLLNNLGVCRTFRI